MNLSVFHFVTEEENVNNLIMNIKVEKLQLTEDEISNHHADVSLDIHGATFDRNI